MFVCMFGTAITELFTGQWIDVLLKNVTDNAILILTLTTGVMVIGRGFAEPVVHRFSPQGAKAAEMAMEEVTDAALVHLLTTAQPAWTSPDGEYGQAHSG